MELVQALYLDDSYLKKFSTKVKEVKDGKFVVLEETAFYPQSGGQPYDTGTIRHGDDVFNVVFVGKFSGFISHEIDKEGLEVGDEVECEINWDRRYQLMKSHTAAHLLSYVFHKFAGAKITGNQLDLEKCRIDFSLEDFDKEKIQDYVLKANEIAAQNVSVDVSYMSRDEAIKDSSLFKLAKALPETLKELRIVSIGEFDKQADGGTHVKNTSELGEIQLLEMKNKGASNRRVYFKVS